MMLHILTKGPHSTASFEMQQAIGEQDSVLLIEEAVTAALDPTWVAWQHYQSRIFMLSEDLTSRGLTSMAAMHQLPTIEMDDFVSLTEQHLKTVTWY